MILKIIPSDKEQIIKISATDLAGNTNILIRKFTKQNIDDNGEIIIFDLYISGSFNNWNPADTEYKMIESGGSYRIIKNFIRGNYEFKFTINRSWDYNYGGENGKLVKDGPNIKLLIPTDGMYEIIINPGPGEKKYKYKFLQR